METAVEDILTPGQPYQELFGDDDGSESAISRSGSQTPFISVPRVVVPKAISPSSVPTSVNRNTRSVGSWMPSLDALFTKEAKPCCCFR